MVVPRTCATGVLDDSEVAVSFCKACALTLNGDDVSNPDAIVCNGRKSALVYTLVGKEREVIITDSVEPITEISHINEMGFVEVDGSELLGKDFPLPIETVMHLIRLGAKVAGEPIRWFVDKEWLAPLKSDGRFVNHLWDFMRNCETKRFVCMVYAVYGEVVICLRCIKRICPRDIFCTLTADAEQLTDIIRSH